MNPEFWHKKWEDREIAFHEGRPNRMLVEHFARTGLEPRKRVFVPLCGKTRDIGWFLENGYRVAGAELNESAVVELFQELGLSPEVVGPGPLKRFRADELEVFVGNIFALSSVELGPVDLVYDRAAMVALPADMRSRYATHLVELTQTAPLFVITFQYDQDKMDGPPFSISQDELRGHYDSHYRFEVLEQSELEGGLKGTVAAVESAHYLIPLS